MEHNHESLPLLCDKDIQELNNIRTKLEQTLMTKLRNAGIYFHSMSRVKTQSSLQRKLSTGKYGAGGRKIQDLIGIRINLFYTEDINICESLLEETFMLDNWSKTEWEENRFEAQKCNGVFHIPSKYLVNLSDDLWKQPFDATFEVQLRTILFEGWHEIEHEMRYKYKTNDEPDDEQGSLWEGQEKNARRMNSIVANLELCDWSIVQIFDNLARDQYEKKHWENALRCKFRLKITQDKLKPEIHAYFDEHPEIFDAFWSVSKQQLVNILLNKKYQKILSPNRVIYLLNKELVNDAYLSEQLDREQFGRVLNKEVKQEMRPLVSDPVFEQTIRLSDGGFEKTCEIIYEWAYQHCSGIFGQMPKQMESISYEVMGYKLSIEAGDDRFSMDMQNISNEEAGVIWHVTAEVWIKDRSVYMSCRHICENIYSRERRYNRPKFMRDIYNQVGFVDAGIVMDEHTEPVDIADEALHELLGRNDRSLPVIVVTKPEHVPDWAQSFGGYTINAEVLCKSLAGICHVFYGDESCIRAAASVYGAEQADGAVFYWGIGESTSMIFTPEMIRTSCFEEVNHSVDADEEYEKAFRYQLRELVCQEF